MQPSNVNDKAQCEYCSEQFNPDETATMNIPSTILFRCPACGRWTEANEGESPPFLE
jgi:uncharacterized Zn finger protein